MVLSWLFPKRCVGCGRKGAWVCEGCRGEIRVVEGLICPGCGGPAAGGKTHRWCRGKTGLDGLTSVLRFEGVVRRLIWKLKYKFVWQVVEEIGGLMLEGLEKEVFKGFWREVEERRPVVVGVPLHWWRKNWRGFNQAEKVGGWLAERWGLEVGRGWMERARYTKPQVKLKKEARARNIRGVFRIRKKEEVGGKAILLVDDVWTTGETMRECGRVLKEAGASWVWGLTVARG